MAVVNKYFKMPSQIKIEHHSNHNKKWQKSIFVYGYEGFISQNSDVENCGLFWLFSSSPLSKYRVLCLFYVLLRLNAWCYAVKYEEQLCSQLSICSPRQISLHYDDFEEFFKIEFERGETGKEPLFIRFRLYLII